MQELGLYYIDLNGALGEDFSEYEFNRQGIPLVRFNRTPDWQINPVTVCQYALTQFNQFKRTDNIEFKNAFLTQAEWLYKNYDIGPNNSAVWYYHINIPFYRLKKPWISGMAQGEALSVLLRAFQLTNDEIYLKLTNKVWNIFSVSVENGGIMSTFPDGKQIIEEYPTTPRSCVLNGFILALFGIYDFWLLTHDYQFKDFFKKCFNSIKENLKLYDTSYWSLYDLWYPSRLTSRSYHRLHLILLKKLYDITGEKIFLNTFTRWKGYLKNPLCNFKWGVTKIKEQIKSE